MEAFMEGYHVMRTHPQLQKACPSLYNTMYGQDTGGIGLPANPNISVRENIQQQFDQLELLSDRHGRHGSRQRGRDRAPAARCRIA